MPIQYNDDEILIIFGTGDIGVHTAQIALNKPENEVFFHQQEPRTIGLEHDDDNGKTTDQFPRPIRLIFSRVDSLDVVVAKLLRVRDSMIEGDGSA